MDGGGSEAARQLGGCGNNLEEKPEVLNGGSGRDKNSQTGYCEVELAECGICVMAKWLLMGPIINLWASHMTETESEHPQPLHQPGVLSELGP